MKTKNSRKGFTIVELVITIAVIGVLTAILVPTFIGLTQKAQKSSDDSLVTNLNKALAIKEAEPGAKANVTFHDAIEDLDEYGFGLAKLVTHSDEKLVWYPVTNRFYLTDDPEIQGVASYRLWTIENSLPETQKYSIYPGVNWTATTVSGLQVGFDAGDLEFTSIAFEHSEAPAREVVIRTNSAETALTVNGYVDSTDPTIGDTIIHYGAAGELNIIACATASYHENGNVAFAEIKKGRIVLEQASEIKHIHVNANDDANGFEEVVIANNGAAELPEKITRDQVDVSEAKKVVTVETAGVSESVYVYPYTDASSTKTGTTEQTATQNTDVSSDLGQLVLDNGSDAGEKAMSNNEKTEVKEEIVETAQNEEKVEKAEDAGYEVTHHDALAPTCTEIGHTAYDSYFVNAEEVKIGYKEIAATGHHADSETGRCVDCDAQVYVFKVGNNLYKANEFSTAWVTAFNGTFKILCDLTLNGLQADQPITVDLNGYTLSLRGHAGITSAIKVYGLTDYNGQLTMQNGTLNLLGTGYSNYGIYSEGNLTLRNMTINSACKTTIYQDGRAWNTVGSALLDNVVINAVHTSGTAYNAHSVSMFGTLYSPSTTIRGCTINSAYNAVVINATNVTIEDTSITASENAAWIIFSATGGSATGTMSISGDTTIVANSDYKRLNAQDGNTITIGAGTYNFNPTSYVDTTLYSVTENEGVWTVAAIA